MVKPVKTPDGQVIHLKTTFNLDDKHDVLYTSGRVVVTRDEKYMFTTCLEDVKVTDLSTGRVIHILKGVCASALYCFLIPQICNVFYYSYPPRANVYLHWGLSSFHASAMCPIVHILEGEFVFTYGFCVKRGIVCHPYKETHCLLNANLWHNATR